MSDYISKSALVDMIVNTPSYVSRCKSYFYRNGYLDGKVTRQHEILDIIEIQPTLDEKEIIRKAFERVVEQLNGLMPIQFNGFGKTLITIEDVIKILKEECGINE